MKLTFFRSPHNSLKRPTTTAATLTNGCAAEERQNCFSDIAAADDDDDVTLSVTRNAKNKKQNKNKRFFLDAAAGGFRFSIYQFYVSKKKQNRFIDDVFLLFCGVEILVPKRSLKCFFYNFSHSLSQNNFRKALPRSPPPPPTVPCLL